MLKIHALFALLFFTSTVFSALGMEDDDTKAPTFIDRLIKCRKRTGPSQKRVKKVLDTRHELPSSNSAQEIIMQRLIEVDDVIIKLLTDETADKETAAVNDLNNRILLLQRKDLFAMYKVHLKEKKQKKSV